MIIEMHDKSSDFTLHHVFDGSIYAARGPSLLDFPFQYFRCLGLKIRTPSVISILQISHRVLTLQEIQSSKYYLHTKALASLDSPHNALIA